MPATESTWRDIGLMHRIFAVSGVVLTISTIWMFGADHARSWKGYQVKVNNIDLKMNSLRQEQYETGEALVEHDRTAAALAAAKSAPIDPQGLAAFKSQAVNLNQVLAMWRSEGYAYSTVGLDEAAIDRAAKNHAELAA